MVRWIVFCLMLVSLFSVAETQTWYFARHFEKQSGDNPSLTKQGEIRASNLAKYFVNKPLNAIFSTQYLRTQETAAATAASKRLDVQSYDPRHLAPFAERLKSDNHVLIIGHSNTTPALMQLMGGKPFEIKETEFGVLFVLVKKGQHLTVSEVPIPL